MLLFILSAMTACGGVYFWGASVSRWRGTGKRPFLRLDWRVRAVLITAYLTAIVYAFYGALYAPYEFYLTNDLVGGMHRFFARGHARSLAEVLAGMSIGALLGVWFLQTERLPNISVSKRSMSLWAKHKRFGFGIFALLLIFLMIFVPGTLLDRVLDRIHHVTLPGGAGIEFSRAKEEPATEQVGVSIHNANSDYHSPFGPTSTDIGIAMLIYATRLYPQLAKIVYQSDIDDRAYTRNRHPLEGITIQEWQETDYFYAIKYGLQSLISCNWAIRQIEGLPGLDMRLFRLKELVDYLDQTKGATSPGDASIFENLYKNTLRNVILVTLQKFTEFYGNSIFERTLEQNCVMFVSIMHNNRLEIEQYANAADWKEVWRPIADEVDRWDGWDIYGKANDFVSYSWPIFQKMLKDKQSTNINFNRFISSALKLTLFDKNIAANGIQATLDGTALQYEDGDDAREIREKFLIRTYIRRFVRELYRPDRLGTVIPHLEYLFADVQEFEDHFLPAVPGLVKSRREGRIEERLSQRLYDDQLLSFGGVSCPTSVYFRRIYLDYLFAINNIIYAVATTPTIWDLPVPSKAMSYRATADQMSKKLLGLNFNCFEDVFPDTQVSDIQVIFASTLIRFELELIAAQDLSKRMVREQHYARLSKLLGKSNALLQQHLDDVNVKIAEASHPGNVDEVNMRKLLKTKHELEDLQTKSARALEKLGVEPGESL
ncbi:hypothetical protein [Acuticoccus mangrovi]|uniref:Uncharacterized protein n=1 Tax=Acuticoccus mangrovi TaxID=2796142 RepID=A0A934ILM1_9HYPH|nr:hypothetical protein [Acuticoccus mangrovi]MBJ3774651.1 hypothetical protein [Acuticoccus mangrovi]